MKYIKLFDTTANMNAAIANSTIGLLAMADNNGNPVVKIKKPSPVPPTPVGPAPNEIWYTTTDNNVAEFYSIYDINGNENSLVNNIYTNGKGVATYTNSIISNNNSFVDGSNISSIILPEGLTDIYFDTFNELTSNPLEVTIPSTVSEMCNFSYLGEFTLIINSPTMIPLNGELFGTGGRGYHEGYEPWAPWHYYEPFYIYVPANLVNTYKADEYWSQYAYAIFPMQ